MTDHSPAPPGLKQIDTGDFVQAWGGIASLQIALPAVWSGAGVRQLGIEDLAQWMSAAPRGSPASLEPRARLPSDTTRICVWDPDAEVCVDAAALHLRHAVTPYHGRRLSGQVHTTILRGEIVFDAGVVSGETRGRIIGPDAVDRSSDLRAPSPRTCSTLPPGSRRPASRWRWNVATAADSGKRWDVERRMPTAGFGHSWLTTPPWSLATTGSSSRPENIPARRLPRSTHRCHRLRSGGGRAALPRAVVDRTVRLHDVPGSWEVDAAHLPIPADVAGQFVARSVRDPWIVGTRGVTAVAVLTLALGIGANTAMFSIVHGILLRPLAYHDSDRLALIQREQSLTGARRPVPALFVAAAELDAWQTRLRSFESTAFLTPEVAALSTDTGAEVLYTAVVSGAFFSTLGGPMAAGRTIGPADDRTASIVISERLAQRLFAGSQQSLGQPLVLSSQPYTVVGVADSDLQFPTARTDVWIPAGVARTLNPRCCGFRMMGRLRPDVTLAGARSEVTASATALSAVTARPPAEMRATVVSLRDQMTGTVRPALLILFAAVGLVLLVACANVVNIQLARQVAQERDAAIRWTLARAQPSRPSITDREFVAGGDRRSGGDRAGRHLRAAAYRLNPPGLPRLDAVQVDVTVLLFSIGLAALAALATGLVPALQSASAADALKFGAACVTTGVRSGRIAACCVPWRSPCHSCCWSVPVCSVAASIS